MWHRWPRFLVSSATIVLWGCTPPGAPGQSGTGSSDSGGPDGSGTTGADSTTHGDSSADGDCSGAGSSGTSSGSSGSTGDESGDIQPPPEGGLEPWGYHFELLPGIVADRVLLEDFDGDGHIDLYTQWWADPEFAVLTHRGDGTGTGFVAGTMSLLDWGGIPVAGDFDGDGLPDVAAFGGREGFEFSFNDGSGGFPSAFFDPHHDDFASFGTVTLDVDGDARDDIILPQGHSSGIDVLLSGAAGSFTLSPNLEQPACYVSGATPTDLDLDGWEDYVVTGSCNAIPGFIPLAVYRGGPAGLTMEQSFAEGDGIHEGADVLATDADGDGHVDIVTPTWMTSLAVFHGDGSGSLGSPQMVPYAWPFSTRELYELRVDPTGPAGYLMDSDSPDEYAVGQWVDGSLDVVAVDPGGEPVGTADLDEDGRSDVVVLVPSRTDDSDTVGVWLSGP